MKITPPPYLPGHAAETGLPKTVFTGPGQTLAEGMEIRAGLCAALAEMSSSMRALLGLMGRHNCITALPEECFPAYERIMERVGAAVSQAAVMVERSRDLDRRAVLENMPADGMPRQ